MKAKDFGRGCFGRNPFDKEARKRFQEEWSKMTDSEKLDFMNRRVEDMGKDRFTVEAIDAHCLEWIKKTPEEKELFVSERKKAMGDHFGHGFCRHGFGHGRHM